MTSSSPRLRHPLNSRITPGERIGSVLLRGVGEKKMLIPGKGTYVRQGNLYSSLLGTLHAQEDTSTASDTTENIERWIISIEPEPKKILSQSSYSANSTTISPKIGDVILGRVTKVIRPTHATVDILAIVSEQPSTSSQPAMTTQPFIQPLHEAYSGTLRTNEIRPNSSLDIEISDCVRPSDILLARIHALGEKDYILSTVEAELGVIKAICESSGREMRAVSWKEMECVSTGVKEARKVAKPRVVKSEE
ncbi:hypothetical protein HJC23_000610 [Cyclotella cryptica]|uniref:Exosome complex component N-terminal domain-containing protein n=1 Tax=Cyclotella cryptica TaxID=29204 RepID=A0ABD3Q6T8_9STRA|eukprot:CCRYP_007997-RA/>CCRYP_007997-RA protein AED:0.28 eAED:0.28 QI:298/1/1/1/1/1/2/995/249